MRIWYSSLMRCSDLSLNEITSIPIGAFSGLAQLTTMFDAGFDKTSMYVGVMLDAVSGACAIVTVLMCFQSPSF